MTVVLADTSSLNYLLLIQELELLPRLYGRIVVPAEVLIELKSADAPAPVSESAKKVPGWIEVRQASSAADPTLSYLDLGERSAISIAQREPNALLLIDEAAGTQEASRRGIRNTGTVGVLRAASILKFVDLPAALNRLMSTNFRISRQLVDALLAEDARAQKDLEP